MGASAHQRGSTVSSTRGYTTPPYMFLEPGNGPRSSSSTDRPARAATSAAAAPAGPAPTTTTSYRSAIAVYHHVVPAGTAVHQLVPIRHRRPPPLPGAWPAPPAVPVRRRR